MKSDEIGAKIMSRNTLFLKKKTNRAENFPCGKANLPAFCGSFHRQKRIENRLALAVCIGKSAG